MDLEFDGELWFWKGPAPWHFVTPPDDVCDALHLASSAVTYGWGMIPCAARIGDTDWATALWPKDGGYILPIKQSVRKAEGLHLGDQVTAHLTVDF